MSSAASVESGRPAEPQRSRVPVLGPARAFRIFGAYVGIHIGTGLAFVLLGVVYFKLTGRSIRAPGAMADLLAWMSPLAIVDHLLCGFVVLRMCRRSLPGPVSTALAPLGWVASSIRSLIVAAAAGVAAFCFYTYGLAVLFPPEADQEWGPLGILVEARGWSRHVFAVSAVFMAPIVEEFLYRGVLLAGFSRSWPSGASGFLVTMMFVVSHLGMVVYGPALANVVILSVAALVARRASGSLLPAIVLHASYNLSVFVYIYRNY